MDTKFSLLEQLLPHIDKYVEEGGEVNPQKFARWLGGDMKTRERVEVAPMENFDPAAFMRTTNPAAALSFYIVRMNKYAKYYLKEAFAHTPMKGADDFAYVATLAYVKGMSKSELIKLNVGETSGGMDIIKRLIRERMIESYPDEVDKRAVKLRLSEFGKGMFFSVLPKLSEVGKIVRAHLGDEEVNEMVEVLASLDQFHKNIYDCEKEYDLGTITEKYLK